MEVYLASLILLVAAIFIWWALPKPADVRVLGLCVLLMPVALEQHLYGWSFSGFSAFDTAGLVLIPLWLRVVVSRLLGRCTAPSDKCMSLSLFAFCLLGLMVALGNLHEKGAMFMWVRICATAWLAFELGIAYSFDIRLVQKMLFVIGLSAVCTAACLWLLARNPANNGVSELDELFTEYGGRLGGGYMFWHAQTLLGETRVLISCNPVQLGNFSGIGLVLAMAYVLGHPSRKARLTALLMGIVLGSIMVLAQARGACIAAVAALAVIFILFLTRSQVLSRVTLVRRTMALATALVLIVVPLSMSRFGAEEGGGMLKERAVALRALNRDNNMIGRRLLWRDAIQLVGAKPLGASFAANFDLTGIRNPHNLYLSLLFGTGWLGAAIAFLALGRGAVIMLRGCASPFPMPAILNTAGLGLIAFLACSGLTNIFFEVSPITTCFWFALGSAVGVSLKAHAFAYNPAATEGDLRGLKAMPS
jgi:O-antigen ligase